MKRIMPDDRYAVRKPMIDQTELAIAMARCINEANAAGECSVCGRGSAGESEAISLPSVVEVLNGPATSHWLRETLYNALILDPTDAASDATLLAAVLGNRAQERIEETQ